MNNNTIYEIPKEIAEKRYSVQDNILNEQIKILSMLGIGACVENLNPVQNNTIDCQTRTLARVLNIDWMSAFDILIERSKKYYTLPDHRYVLISLIEEYGYTETEDDYVSPVQFMINHKDGVWYDSPNILEYIAPIFIFDENDKIFEKKNI